MNRYTLPPDTPLRIVAKKEKTGEVVAEKVMTYCEWMALEKRKGFIYRAYQVEKNI